MVMSEKKYLFGLVVCVTVLTCVSCNKLKKNIIGEWRWTGTIEHYVNGSDKIDTTFSVSMPDYKDVAFHSNGRATLDALESYCKWQTMVTVRHVSDPSYKYSVKGDTLFLENEYTSSFWIVRSCSKNNLVIEYSESGNKTYVYHIVSTYCRK